MNKINTVNVLEIIEDTPSSIRSFPDNPEGNEEAEELFTKCVLENEGRAENMEYYLDEGYYENRGGFKSGYGVYIIHST